MKLQRFASGILINLENYLSELAELGGSICCFFTDADIFQNWKPNICENVQNNGDTFLHQHMIYFVAFDCDLKETTETERRYFFFFSVFFIKCV